MGRRKLMADGQYTLHPQTGLVKSQQLELATLAAGFKKYLEYDPDAKLSVEAYADTRGSKQFNQELSERRVERIKQYLVDQGIAADKVQTAAYGKERPLEKAAVKDLESNNPNPAPIPGDHWPLIENEARFYRTLKLSSQYSRTLVLPEPRRMDGREVYVVQADIRGDEAFSDMLYFDAQNGLLIRRDTFHRGLLSPGVIQTEFEPAAQAFL